MSPWRHMTHGLRSLWNRSAAERDIADEVEHYYEEAAASLQSTGLSREEARRAVRVEFGHARIVQERVGAYGWENVVDSVGADLRYGARQLYRHPAFAFATVLTLALGIGATTAIFSVVYSVVIKPLPYPNADALVRIRHSAPGMNTDDLGSSPTMYLTYRGENRTFANLGLWQEDSVTLTSLGEPERVPAVVVSNGTLQALGVQPTRGRWFTEREYAPAAEGAAVILSYGFWQRRFGGEEAALGRQFSIDALGGNGYPRFVGPSRVVGIMPANFRFLDLTPQPDVILAMRLDPARQAIGNFGVQALGRLRRGATLAQARTDLERMVPIWLDAWPLIPVIQMTRAAIANWHITPVLRPLKDDMVGGVASTLWVLMGAIGAVLLIACANITNLMLVRAEARRHEFAVRTALGAGRARIARGLLAESLVIGGAGGVLGWALAYAGLQVVIALGPSGLPRLQEISVYPPVLAFTVAVSLASTLLFGSITALKQALHTDMVGLGGDRASNAVRGRSMTRSALVVVQVALALVLVVGAALMIRTFQALRDVNPGFSDAATVHTTRIWVPSSLIREPQRYTRMQREILDKIAALPGVASAAFTSVLPMEGRAQNAVVVVEGQTAAAAAMPPRRFKYVSPGYFATMGTRLIAGRDVTWSDIEAGGRVAVISEDFARELASEPAGALGKRIRVPVAQDTWRDVIGVVESVHEDTLYEEPTSFVYWPALMANFFGSAAFGTPNIAFVIRSEHAGTTGLTTEIRQAVRSVNEAVPITLEGTMQDLYGESLARTSFTLVMLVIAGAMALVLGVIGVYAVIVYIVQQRIREIGIRLALGARPQQLRRMFLRKGLALSGVGAAAGLIAAVALGRVMTSLLFGIGPFDPAAYVAALGVTIAAAALASYMPARRAATIEPTTTMKMSE